MSIAMTALMLTALASPDRSKPPAVMPPSPITLPQTVIQNDGHGLIVRWMRVPGLSRVAVLVRLSAGEHQLSSTNNALTSVFSALWGVATQSLDRQEMTDLLRLADIDLHTSVDTLHSSVSMTSPREVWHDGLSLLADVIRAPVFPTQDLKLTRTSQARYWTTEIPRDADSLASVALNYAWYTPSHALGRRPNPRAINATSKRALEKLHDKFMGFGPVEVVIVGDVDPVEDAARVQAAFAGIAAANPNAPHLGAPEVPSSPQILAIDVPGTSLTSLRYRLPAPALNHVDALSYAAAVFALDGTFLSRLNRNLREDKGWTYGVSTAWERFHDLGTWTITTSIPADKTSEAIAQITAEIENLVAHGPTKAEIHDWQTSQVDQYNNLLMTASGAAHVLNELGIRGWEIDDLTRRLEQTAHLTARTAEITAQHWLKPQHALIVVAGDRTALQANLQRAGIPVQWVSAADAALGDFTLAAP